MFSPLSAVGNISTIKYSAQLNVDIQYLNCLHFAAKEMPNPLFSTVSLDYYQQIHLASKESDQYLGMDSTKPSLTFVIWQRP